MAEFDFNIVKNPEIFQQNRLAAHSDHEWYTAREAVADGFSDNKELLNGVWYFNYAKNPSLAPEGFWAEDVDCRAWDRIRVPAHIQMEGYDIPQYANTQYPWEGTDEVRPGQIPERFNPTASYVKYFTVPEAMTNGPVYICFQGVESGFALWCNGKYVGYSEDSFTPSEFDLTGYVHEGENKLAVRVFKWTAGSWCEDQDFYRFSGIFRDVYLYTIPQVHVLDMKVRTILDDNYQDADLLLDLEATAAGKARITLLDGDTVVVTAEEALSAQNHFSYKIEKPALWSAESPKLYSLEIEVSDENGTFAEIIREEVGFRRFELKDGLMLLNGKRIVFKGTDRHEFSSETGRVLGDEDIYKDLVNMKRHNINAVRTSHYPNKTSFYRMCDRLGLYLIDEANLETHGTWDAYIRGLIKESEIVPKDRPEFQELIIDRARNMFERDKNHASILIWSCGNESWGGVDILNMSNCFREWDATRLVHYEGTDHDKTYPETTDMYSTMYLSVELIKEQLTQTDKPYVCCEYTHAMGNSCGAMHKYTELADVEPRYQGGFIWDYIDQSISAKTRYGEDYQAYGGDLGDRPCDYSFSGNGIAYGGPDRLSSPKMQEVKYNYQNIKLTFDGDRFEVFNDNLFTNTDAFRTVAVLKKEGKVLAKKELTLSVAPGERKTFDLPIAKPEAAGEYTEDIIFLTKEDTEWADAGFEVAYGQTVLGQMVLPTPSAAKLTVMKGWANVAVAGDEFEAIFSIIHGGLVSYKYCGEQMLEDLPRPNFWRAMTENDIANQLANRGGQWKIASTFSNMKYEHGTRFTYPEITEEDGRVIVAYTYHLATMPVVDCKMVYTVYGDGRMDVHLDLDPSAQVGVLPEFGALFTMNADYDRLKWYGRGPEETYMDRKHAKIDVYENRVEDNMAKYLKPGECGNKTDVRYAEVTDHKGRGLRFWGDAVNFSALPYSPDMLDYAQHAYELPKVYKTWIRISMDQMGIAGDDTWGAVTHPEYNIDNTGRLTFDFSFKGI